MESGIFFLMFTLPMFSIFGFYLWQMLSKFFTKPKNVNIKTNIDYEKAKVAAHKFSIF